MREWKDQVGERLRMVSGGGLHRGWFYPWSPASAGNWWREPDPEMEFLPSVGMHRGDLASMAKWLGYDCVFLGLRRQESLRRSDILASATGMDKVRGYLHVNPIIDWSESDVWDYIDAEGLPYCPVYDRLTEVGVSRHRARLGPLPLSEGQHLWKGWPKLYAALVRRYGQRWTRPVGKRCPPGVSPLDWLEIQDALR